MKMVLELIPRGDMIFLKLISLFGPGSINITIPEGTVRDTEGTHTHAPRGI